MGRAIYTHRVPIARLRTAGAGTLLLVLTMLPGCPDKHAAAIESVRTKFEAFSPRFVEALHATAKEWSDFDGGTIHAFEGPLGIASIIAHGPDAPVVRVSIKRHFESGRQVGSGPTKQTEWVKIEGFQSILLQGIAEPPGWRLIESSFDGLREVKPLSLYTDRSRLLTELADEIPEQDALIRAALNVLADRHEAPNR